MILKSTPSVIVDRQGKYVFKKSLNDQADAELIDELSWFEEYKKYQGYILPFVTGVSHNCYKMDYCMGEDKIEFSLLQEALTGFHNKTGKMIDWLDWSWLIKSELVNMLDSYLSQEESDYLVSECKNIFKKNIPSYICHGDLHSDNIFCKKKSLKIIDPKPVLFDFSYDLVYFLLLSDCSLSIITSFDLGKYAHDMLVIAYIRKLHVYAHIKSYDNLQSMIGRYKDLTLILSS